MSRPRVVPIQQPSAGELVSLADSVALLRTNGFESIVEASIFCAVLGEPKTLAEIVKELRLPFSTVSRVAWDLYGRELLTYADGMPRPGTFGR
jgi:hypothetical protein